MAVRKVKDTDFLRKARERYKLADEADSKQAIREREDISFEDGDQWPADIQLARQGQQPTSGMPAVPARPTLVINKLREPVENVLNQARQADLGVQIVAAEDFGDLGIIPDDTEIELREGLTRRIQRNSDASDARLWAFKRALIAGRGYYLVNTRYLPGKTFDQEVYIHRIYNQEAVKGDPSRQKPDGSDADWWFVGTWMPWDRFKGEYPEDADGRKNQFSEYSEQQFISLTEDYPDWYQAAAPADEKTGKGAKQAAVRIVDHWYTERAFRKIAILDTGDVVDFDEVPKGATVVQSRNDIVPQIKFCKIAGGLMEVERTDWAGPDMPVIQVLGNEVLPYDEQKRYEGMIRQSRSAQMGENVMISKFVESVGLAPIPRDRVDPEAIDGFEDWWKVANTRTLPYLPYRSRNDQGQETRPPLPGNADPNILPMAQGIALFDQFIRSTSAVPDPSLGNVDPSLKSDRAIKTVIANAAKSTGHYLDNFGRSVSYEGKVINNLLYPIYGARPGRLVRLLTGENETQMAAIGEPPQQGQAAQPSPQQMQAQKIQKVAKLTKDANFNVIIKLAPNSDNRRAQFVQMFAQLLAADPHQMAVAGDMFYKNMDIPEARELAARQKAMLAPPVQAYIQAKEQGAVDPQSAVVIQQLKQQVQHAEAAMGELKQQADGKMVSAQAQIHAEELKQQGENQRKQMEMDRDLQLQQMKDATSIRVAEIQAETKGIIEGNAAQVEALALNVQQAHEADQAELDRQHERDLAASQQAHDVATGAAEQDGAMQSQVMQHQADAAQQQQQPEGTA
jgi:hypothetical protein